MEVDITEKVKRGFHGVLFGLVALAVLVCGGIWYWQQHATYEVICQARVQGVSGSVSAKTDGKVKEILVADGDMVEPGQLLATLEVQVSPEQVEELAAALEGAKRHYSEVVAQPEASAVSPSPVFSGLDITAAKAKLDRAAIEKEKMDKLFALGAISAVQHNQAVTAYQAALSEFSSAQSSSAAFSAPVHTPRENKAELLKIAELQVKQAQAAYEQSKMQQQSAQIFAPVGGIVEFKGVEAGLSITSGQPLFTISHTDDMWVETRLEAAQAEKLSLGRFVSYTIAAYPGQRFEGTVYEIADAPEESQTVKEKIVRVSLPANAQVAFRPGMDVKLKIGF